MLNFNDYNYSFEAVNEAGEIYEIYVFQSDVYDVSCRRHSNRNTPSSLLFFLADRTPLRTIDEKLFTAQDGRKFWARAQ